MDHEKTGGLTEFNPQKSDANSEMMWNHQ